MNEDITMAGFKINNPQWQYAIERIEKEKAKDMPLPQHREMPPGAPIGCDED